MGSRGGGDGVNWSKGIGKGLLYSLPKLLPNPFAFLKAILN